MKTILLSLLLAGCAATPIEYPPAPTSEFMYREDLPRCGSVTLSQRTGTSRAVECAF